MADYGFRVSADGVDVKSGADKDMVLTSKYSMLKGSLSGTGTVSVPRDGTPTTVTIAHGLGYIPMVQAFYKDDDGTIQTPGVYFPIPAVFSDSDETFFVQMNIVAKADSTNIYLIFTIQDLI